MFFVNFVNIDKFIEGTKYNDIIYNGEYERVPQIGERVRINLQSYRIEDILNDVKSRGTEKPDDDNFQPKPIHYYVYLREII